MISGVTSGEINNPVSNVRPGIAGCASPSAARVPSRVVSRVAATPMVMLFTSARCHSSSPATPRYQRSDQASGSSRSIPSVKVK